MEEASWLAEKTKIFLLFFSFDAVHCWRKFSPFWKVKLKRFLCLILVKSHLKFLKLVKITWKKFVLFEIVLKILKAWTQCPNFVRQTILSLESFSNLVKWFFFYLKSWKVANLVQVFLRDKCSSSNSISNSTDSWYVHNFDNFFS